MAEFWGQFVAIVGIIWLDFKIGIIARLCPGKAIEKLYKQLAEREDTI